MNNFQHNLSNEFFTRLKIGNQKEKYVCSILNLLQIPCQLNNLKEKTNIDLFLPNDDIYIDVKYIHTPFINASGFSNLTEKNCIPIKTTQINKYNEFEINNNKEVWVAFLIYFKKFDIFELNFIPNSQLKYLLDQNKNVYKNLLNIDKNIGRNINSFSLYLNNRRIVNTKKYKFND